MSAPRSNLTKTLTLKETAVILPHFLYDNDISQIVPPLPTQTGQLWGNLGNYKTILYPYIEGHDGYEVDLAPHHWLELGTALKQLHTVKMPPAIRNGIRQETYSSEGRKTVKRFLNRIETEQYTDPVANELAAFLNIKRNKVLDLIEIAYQGDKIGFDF